MFKIEKTLSVEVDEDGIREAVIEKIAREHPDIVVDEVNFVSRLKPTRIEAAIKARFADSVKGDNLETAIKHEPDPKKEPEVETGNKPSALKPEVKEEIGGEETPADETDTPVEEPAADETPDSEPEAKEEETPPKTVGSLFD